jgi:hypothetical protein
MGRKKNIRPEPRTRKAPKAQKEEQRKINK